MVYTDACFEIPCLKETNKVIQTFESGKTECTLDVAWGHDVHVYERVMSKFGGKVVHHVIEREPRTNQVPRNYLEYIQD